MACKSGAETTPLVVSSAAGKSPSREAFNARSSRGSGTMGSCRIAPMGRAPAGPIVIAHAIAVNNGRRGRTRGLPDLAPPRVAGLRSAVIFADPGAIRAPGVVAVQEVRLLAPSHGSLGLDENHR